jgi:hypothetical protein
MFNCKFVLYHINEHYKDDDGNNITEYTTIEKESYSSSRPPHTIHLLLTNSTHFEPLFVQTKAASSSTPRNPPQIHSAPALHSGKAAPTSPRDVSSTSEATTTTVKRKQLSVQQLPPPLPLTKNQRVTAPKKSSEHHHEQPQSSLPSPITSKTISQVPSLLTSPAQATAAQDNASPSVNSPSQRRIAAAPPLNKPLSNSPLILKPAPAPLRLAAHLKRRSKTTVKEKPPSMSRSKQFSPQDPITSNPSSPPSPQAAAAQSSQDQPPQKKQKLLSDYFPPPKNRDNQSLTTRKRKLPHDLQALEISQQTREQKQTQRRHIP